MTLPNSVEPIEADVVVLNDDLVSSLRAFALNRGAPNVIRAWRVEIQGIARSAGQDVTIVANQVVFASDGLIDTSGNDGVEQWTPGNKPPPPDQPGTTGTTGDSGDNGKDAGNITIFAGSIIGTVNVRAVGGAGRRGRDGGDGAKGATGTPGGDIQTYLSCTPPTGNKGFPGGQGGTAGLPGTSGRGGNLDVWIPPGSAAPTIVANLVGGAAPASANPGNPGGGGDGGPGGTCIITTREPPQPHGGGP